MYCGRGGREGVVRGGVSGGVLLGSSAGHGQVRVGEVRMGPSRAYLGRYGGPLGGDTPLPPGVSCWWGPADGRRWPPCACVQGTLPGSRHSYTLDDHHTFQTGKWYEVCGNTGTAGGCGVALAPHAMFVLQGRPAPALLQQLQVCSLPCRAVLQTCAEPLQYSLPLARAWMQGSAHSRPGRAWVRGCLCRTALSTALSRCCSQHGGGDLAGAAL